MQDIDELVDACKSICGFRKRSRVLDDMARNAIKQAFARSHRPHGESATLETERRCIDQSGMTEMPSNDHIANAGFGSAGASQILLTHAEQNDITTLPAEAAAARPSYPTPIPLSNRQDAGDQPSSLSQWRPCVPQGRSYQGIAQSTTGGLAPGGGTSLHAMPSESHETVYPSEAGHHLAFSKQPYLGQSQDYGGASRNASTWEECSDDQFGNLLNLWDVTFP